MAFSAIGFYDGPIFFPYRYILKDITLFSPHVFRQPKNQPKINQYEKALFDRDSFRLFIRR
jgi:hypothetical protein